MELEKSLLIDLFYQMLRIRLVEEKIAESYPQQKMRCPVHLSIGQEAVAAGVCKALLHSDLLVSGHRAHAHYLAKGGDLKAMIAELHGKIDGCVLGRGGSMHLIDPSVGMMGSTPIVGSSMPVGVGMAFATSLKKERDITVIFIGDAATEEGVFTECLNFASLKKLPVLFISENNFFSVYSPLDVRQPKERDVVAIAQAHGIWAAREYGNDVEKVHALSQRAVDRIRDQQGPCFLEFTTYRYREHCGPNFDEDLCYRSQEESQYWLERCPVQSAQKILLERGELDLASLQEMQEQIDQEIEEAFEFAAKSPFPNPSIPEPVYG